MKEILNIAEKLKEYSKPFKHYEDSIDVVGIGGCKDKKFNVSTATSIVLAHMGYKVVKHGSYGRSTTSGASNALKELGVNIFAQRDVMERCCDKTNFAYIHASEYNECLDELNPIRSRLTSPNLFNYIIPLLNPSEPHTRVVGVYGDVNKCIEIMLEIKNHLYKESNILFVGSYDNDENFSVYDELDPYKNMFISNGYDRINIKPNLNSSYILSHENYPKESANSMYCVLDGNFDFIKFRMFAEMVAINCAVAICAIKKIPLHNIEKEIGSLIESTLETLRNSRVDKTMSDIIFRSKYADL